MVTKLNILLCNQLSLLWASIYCTSICARIYYLSHIFKLLGKPFYTNIKSTQILAHVIIVKVLDNGNGSRSHINRRNQKLLSTFKAESQVTLFWFFVGIKDKENFTIWWKLCWEPIFNKQTIFLFGEYGLGEDKSSFGRRHRAKWGGDRTNFDIWFHLGKDKNVVPGTR